MKSSCYLGDKLNASDRSKIAVRAKTREKEKGNQKSCEARCEKLGIAEGRCHLHCGLDSHTKPVSTDAALRW